MTADVRGGLASALRDWTGAWTPAERRELIDALLPVVQRLAVEKAAEELRVAAADFAALADADWSAARGEHVQFAAERLIARADALAAAAQPTDGRTGE